MAIRNDIANFVKKTDFDEKLKNLNKKISSNKTKHVVAENELKRLQTFDSSLFISQSYFNNDGAQVYLILQSLYYTLKRLGDTEKVLSWKSEGLSAEKLTTPSTTDNSLSPSIKWYENSNFCLIFKGSCLKQKNRNFYSSKCNKFFYCLWIRYIVTRFKFWFYFKGLLIGGVKLAKTAHPDKYVYSGCGIGFDSRSEFSLTDGRAGKNVIIFGADMSSSMHMGNEEKDVLILGIGLTQGLDDTALTAEGQHSINFSRSNRKFSSSLHYNGSNSFLFANFTKIYQFEAKDSEIKNIPCV